MVGVLVIVGLDMVLLTGSPDSAFALCLLKRVIAVGVTSVDQNWPAYIQP